MADPASASPLKILLWAPNWLGDVVMATPLLAWLSAAARLRHDVEVQLHLGVRRAWAPLFRRDPRLSGLVVIERSGRHGGWRGVTRLAADLRVGGFAAAALGPPSLRAALVTALAGIPHRVGHAGDGRRLLLTRALRRGSRGAVHHSRELLDLGPTLLESLGWPRGSLPADDEVWRAALPGCADTPSATAPTARPLWAVGPGATYGAAKTWPLENLAGLLHVAVTEHNARVVLLGDGGAAAFVAPLRRTGDLRWGEVLADSRCDIVDLTGRTDLLTVVGILKRSAAYVGNDSGLMHLAGALNVPTVGIFGSSNPAWTAPLGPATTTVVADGFSCHPCYRRTCNQPEFCLETVTPATVVAALQRTVTGVQDEPGGNAP